MKDRMYLFDLSIPPISFLCFILFHTSSRFFFFFNFFEYFEFEELENFSKLFAMLKFYFCPIETRMLASWSRLFLSFWPSIVGMLSIIAFITLNMERNIDKPLVC